MNQRITLLCIVFFAVLITAPALSFAAYYPMTFYDDSTDDKDKGDSEVPASPEAMISGNEESEPLNIHEVGVGNIIFGFFGIVACDEDQKPCGRGCCLDSEECCDGPSGGMCCSGTDSCDVKDEDDDTEDYGLCLADENKCTAAGKKICGAGSAWPACCEINEACVEQQTYGVKGELISVFQCGVGEDEPCPPNHSACNTMVFGEDPTIGGRLCCPYSQGGGEECVEIEFPNNPPTAVIFCGVDPSEDPENPRPPLPERCGLGQKICRGKNMLRDMIICCKEEEQCEPHPNGMPRCTGSSGAVV